VETIGFAAKREAPLAGSGKKPWGGNNGVLAAIPGTFKKMRKRAKKGGGKAA